MSEQKPQKHLTGYQLRHLGQFVTELNKISREHGVDVCVYGAIVIEVTGASSEMRVELDRDGDGDYIIRELT